MKLISTTILIFIAIMISQSTNAQGNNSFIVVYNNMESENNLRCDWGFAAWIKMGEEVVLFDTGNKPAILKQNLEKLNLDPRDISVIAISHDHYDHIGGLESILSFVTKKTKVYLPGETDLDFQENYPDLNFIVNDKFQKISKNVWLTTVFENNIHEQALVIKTEGKLIMITGCAHPGIVEMAESVKNKFSDKKLGLLTGGFHLQAASENEVIQISDNLKALGLEKIAPSHCTGEHSIAVFKENWQENFVQLNIGDSYRF